jgi:glycosyltransferase involved in cell wall biosynthesis
LQISQSINKRTPVVQVLLATLNGEKYLKEFLNSLLLQNAVKIKLIISDDGSSDATLSIIESYANSFESLVQLKGPRKGPAANFFFLLDHANAEFIALADQDDIWEPDHLLNSINRLNKSRMAALTYSKCTHFGTGLKEVPWPTENSLPSFVSFLVQNRARGCTMVLNKPMLQLARLHKPKNAIMHDWWLALLAYSCGEIIYAPSREVKYRIHSQNAVGVRQKPIWHSLTSIVQKNFWAPEIQALELLQLYQAQMNIRERDEVVDFTMNLRAKFFRRLYKLVFTRTRFRINSREDVMLKIGFIIFPWIFKERPYMFLIGQPKK